MLVILILIFSRYWVARLCRLIVLFHHLCEGSARGNWDPRGGQQPFRPNPNGVGDRTTTLRQLLTRAAFSFLRPRLIYASPGWFPLRSVTNIIKLERLYWAASRAIAGCLLSSPIPLLLSKVSLLPLRVILTHFAMSSYERALRLPTSFHISGLPRLGVKSKFFRSSWRAFASTHPLVLLSTSLWRLSLLALLHFFGTFHLSLWSLLFPPHPPALIPYISPRYSSCSPWLSLTSWSGDRDRRLCSFSFW